MSIVNTLAMKSNRQIKINFDGGYLFSDAGLLLMKEFVSKLGIDKLFNQEFKTNDSALFRYHTDKQNLLQMIYMILQVHALLTTYLIGLDDWYYRQICENNVLTPSV